MRPFLQRRKGAARYGLYYIMMSHERGPSFRIAPPKFATADSKHMILRAQRSRYRHYYFYIYDEVLGAMLLRIATAIDENASQFSGLGNAGIDWLAPRLLEHSRLQGEHAWLLGGKLNL